MMSPTSSVPAGAPARASWLAPGLSPRTRTAAFIVSGTFFIEQLDTTIIATAIPEIARSLAADPLTLNLAMTAYMLGLAIFVPVSGRLADRYGTRTVFSRATLLFVLASLLCAVSTSAAMLIAARFLQGIGGAMMAPVGRLIVLKTASKSELVEAMAWVLLPAMLAPMIGPALGGAIATYASWHWIFLINVPLGLIAIGFIQRHLKNERGAQHTRFDHLGTLLVGASFALVTVVLEMLSHSLMGVWTAATALLAGVALFGAYRAHARRHAAPVLDLGLLALPSFRLSMLGGSLFRIGVGGVPFLLPVALQLAYGMSALASGLVVLLPAAGGFAMKFLTTRILQRYGYRTALIGNGVLAALFLGLIALASPAWPGWLVGSLLLLFGFSRSLHMNAYGTLAYADVDRERMSSATSFFLSIQNLTVGLGVAFSALSVRMAELVLPQQPASTHFAFAFGLLTLCCVASLAVSFLMERGTGAELLSRKAAAK